MSRSALSSIFLLWVACPFFQFMSDAAVFALETQTKPSYNLTGSSSIETNIFLPTLSSDTMSFTKLSDFTHNKRFKPRVPKRVVPNKASTTYPTTATSDIEEATNEETGDHEPQDSSSPSPTSLLAKKNFFRRRRKPDIKATLGVSEEFDVDSKDALSEKAKNETAVDIIMQKIKRAQKFKSGRKSFHGTSGLNKNRKRLIKNRARFRPPITTDKTIPNTSTAPILATNEKLMRIAANRRKKQEKENVIQSQTKKSSHKNIKNKNTTLKRRNFSKKDWRKKTKKPSLVGAKLKAMREKRKNKYKTQTTQKSRVQLSNVDGNKYEENSSEETEVTTEPVTSTDSNTPSTTQKSRKTSYSKYPRVVIHRPVKKPENKTLEKTTKKTIEVTTVSNVNDTSTQPDQSELTTKRLQKNTPKVFKIDGKQETTKDETAQRITIKPRTVGYKITKSDIRQKINRKTTLTKTKKPYYSFRPKETTAKKAIKETIETSPKIDILKKELYAVTTPSIIVKKTTEQPNDLKYSATTQRFEENGQNIEEHNTIRNSKASGKELSNHSEAEVEAEATEPEPEPPTPPKVDWSGKRKHRNSLFDRRNRKNFLKGSFIRVDDSQFSASENEDFIADDYPILEAYDYEVEESADPEVIEDTPRLQTLYDIDTFGENQYSQEHDLIENITPKIKRKVSDDQTTSRQSIQTKIQNLRNEVISSIIEKYPTEVFDPKDDNNDEFSTIRGIPSSKPLPLDSRSTLIQTSNDLDTEEGKQQITSLGVESLASLVNLPSSFDSINDEDNFIFTDRYPNKNADKKTNVNPVLEENISRRQDAQKVQLIDIVESEKQENGDLITEALDDKIIRELEAILEIDIPEDSKIRRKNSANRIIRRQNPLSQNHIIPSKDFVDVLPNGTSLVSKYIKTSYTKYNDIFKYLILNKQSSRYIKHI